MYQTRGQEQHSQKATVKAQLSEICMEKKMHLKNSLDQSLLQFCATENVSKITMCYHFLPVSSSALFLFAQLGTVRPANTENPNIKMFLEEFISVYCTEKLYALLFAIWNYQNPGIAVVLVSHAQMYTQTQ